MFFLSVNPDPTGIGVTILTVRGDFKTVSKQYMLTAIEHERPADGAGALAEAIRRRHGGRAYEIRKRLFSQDGRPAKTVLTAPRVLVNVTRVGMDAVTILRNAGVVVEAFWIKPGTGECMTEAIGRAVGSNYRVFNARLLECLATVWRQGRLVAGPEVSWAGTVAALDVLAAGRDPGSERHRLVGLAMPVWLRESVRYVRVYRA